MFITFILVATTFFGLLGLIWTKDSLFNIIIKCFLIVMTIWGVGLIINNASLFAVQ